MKTEIGALTALLLFAACSSQQDPRAPESLAQPHDQIVVRYNQTTGVADYAPAESDFALDEKNINRAHSQYQWTSLPYSQTITDQSGYPQFAQQNQMYFMQNPGYGYSGYSNYFGYSGYNYNHYYPSYYDYGPYYYRPMYYSNQAFYYYQPVNWCPYYYGGSYYRYYLYRNWW